jgi:nucleotide-binding universal stress UspA family protein
VYIDPATDRVSDIRGAEENIKLEAQQLLDTQVEQIKAAGGTVAQTHVRLGRPAQEIVNLADKIAAGLIVVGSRGLGGIRRALMGSVSDSVVRHAHCPVMVVRKEER